MPEASRKSSEKDECDREDSSGVEWPYGAQKQKHCHDNTSGEEEAQSKVAAHAFFRPFLGRPNAYPCQSREGQVARLTDWRGAAGQHAARIAPKPNAALAGSVEGLQSEAGAQSSCLAPVLNVKACGTRARLSE